MVLKPNDGLTWLDLWTTSIVQKFLLHDYFSLPCSAHSCPRVSCWHLLKLYWYSPINSTGAFLTLQWNSWNSWKSWEPLSQRYSKIISALPTRNVVVKRFAVEAIAQKLVFIHDLSPFSYFCCFCSRLVLTSWASYGREHPSSMFVLVKLL